MILRIYRDFRVVNTRFPGVADNVPFAMNIYYRKSTNSWSVEQGTAIKKKQR